MNTTAHNHPPRCCCGVPPIAADDQTATPCPLCIEHGELAQLAENREYPGQPGEKVMPCCHQLAGRPHTDYCPARPVVDSPVPAEVQELADRMVADDLANGAHVDLAQSLRDAVTKARERRTEEARAHVQAGYPQPSPRTPTPPIDSWPVDPHPADCTHPTCHHPSHLDRPATST